MSRKITSTNETHILELADKAKARWEAAVFAATDTDDPNERRRLLLLALKHQQAHESLSRRTARGK